MLDIDTLKQRGLSILRLSVGDWLELQETRALGHRFTSVFPHRIARSAKTRAPVLMVISGGAIPVDEIFGDTPDAHAEPHLKLGWVRSIQAVATRDSRVAFDHVQPVVPQDLNRLMGETVPTRLRSSADRLLASSLELEEVSPKLGEWLLERLVAQPDNVTAFRRLLALVHRPTRYRNAIALQEDALALALKAFGAPNAAASSLAIGERVTALAGARLQEDVMIEHDARWIPDWTLDSSDVTGRAVFTQGRDELQVFTANKQPLENLFGVDLIYLNETRRSIVMVQYKMVEPLGRSVRAVETSLGTIKEKDEPEWIVPVDTQFRDEMARMERFDRPDSERGSYRMTSSPFFFKLVRRYGATGGPGILLSLGHLQQMLSKGHLNGPRGGLRIAYSELNGHYLRGETFVDLVRSGYIGSHSATTDHLQTLIDVTLSEGRAAVAAIQRALPDTQYSQIDPYDQTAKTI
jgi:hypothetical protein